MKVELDDMAAGYVAAPDALPPAAVLPLPRREEALRVIRDAGFDGQQGFPLPRDASSSIMRPPCIRLGPPCCGFCEQEQEDCECKHGGLVSQNQLLFFSGKLKCCSWFVVYLVFVVFIV